jgi:hypothetical protein
MLEYLRKKSKMIKNPSRLNAFNDRLIRDEPIDIFKNFRLLDSLYEEALTLGVFPLKDPLYGIEVDIKIAKVLNSV